MRIVYMGTPEFAVEPLKRLVEGGYNVVGVITMPDKPAGRGYKLQFSPVKEYALSQNIPLLQPEKLKDEGFLSELKALNADLQIVVAFRMLPEVVWNMPPKGTFNLHASLLPDYRGAAPINWAIINGETKSGVSTFFLQHAIDTGNIILQREVEIEADDNVGTYSNKLMLVGGQAVIDTVELIINDKVIETPQPQIDIEKKAPKLFKENTRIDWNTGAKVVNFVRGLTPFPAAWCEVELNDSEIVNAKISQTRFEADNTRAYSGNIISDGKKHLGIEVDGGVLYIEKMQLPGKKMMDIKDILCGKKITKII